MTDILTLAFAMSILRVSAPLVLTAMGGLISERSGVVNIALEGFMLIGAFVAACFSLWFHSAWMGWMAGGVAGMAIAGIYALFVIEFESEPVVAGTALNLLMIGSIPLANKILFNSTGSTPALGVDSRFEFEPIVWSLGLPIILYFWLQNTSSGFWVSFAGRKPEALAPQGVSLKKVRTISVLLSGLFAAWGGATLSLFLSSAYSPLMSGGRGFMALAAVIFGRWNPLLTALACLFFGLTEALQIRLQGVVIGDVKIPVQFIQILPFIVTLIVVYQPFQRKKI